MGYWLINYYLTSTELGLYALGAKFILVINMIMAVFFNTYTPFSMQILHGDSEKLNRVFRISFRYFVGVSMVIVIILTGLSPFLIQLIAPPEYSEALIIVGPMLLSRIIWRTSYFSGLGIWKAKKTHLTALSAFLGMGIGAILNVWLIQSYGILGSAIATNLGLILFALLNFYFSQKHFNIKYNFPLTIVQSLICIGSLIIFHLSVIGSVRWTYSYVLMSIAVCIIILITIGQSGGKGSS